MNYHLATRPAEVQREDINGDNIAPARSGVFETDSVKDFGDQMHRRGVLAWWRKGMEYEKQDDRL